jgi:hypothetical protein
MPHLPHRHVVPDARVELVFHDRMTGMPTPSGASDGDPGPTARFPDGGVLCETGKGAHGNKYSESVQGVNRKGRSQKGDHKDRTVLLSHQTEGDHKDRPYI